MRIDWLGSITGCKRGGAPCATTETITFTATPTPQGRPFQACDVFAWNFGDGTTSALQKPTKTYNAALGDGNVFLQITNCSGGFADDGDGIVVKPLTVLPSILSFTASAPSIVLGQSVTFAWNTQNGSKSVRIENEHESSIAPILKVDRGPTGTYPFTPPESMNYTLTALGDAGQRMSRIGVEVLTSPPSCTENATTLCLTNNRFSVRATYQDGKNAAAVRFTSESGYFYFEGKDNVELVIKVSPACVPSFQRYWVFAAGLTNQRVTLTVTDTKTGLVKTYNNPANTAFQPILDTNAFATCP